jgi:hypothetical protein
MSRVLFSAILAFGLLSIVPMGISAKVIAKVGGYPITLKEANQFVKRATRGKATYSMLKSSDKKRVIKALATDKFVMETATRRLNRKEKYAIWVDLYVRKHYKELLAKAKKELTVKEKKAANADLWVRKKSSKIKVTEAELKKAYRKNKKLFKNRKTGKVAPYSKVKPFLKMQVQQQKFIKKLMKNVKIDYNPKTSTAKK